MLEKVSDQLWDYAEVALKEHHSARYLADALENEGFDVQRGLADLPTSFLATWGDGEPVIGFLAEYDALSGLSQEAVPYRKERPGTDNGHGCGHNLLGTAILGAVLGLKQQMIEEGMTGTIRFYGCPAEENLSGKAFMAREGLFDDCDACLTWHPGAVNRVRRSSSLANNAMNIEFFGQAAHAAGDPHNGRSGLDAVQLMNMGVEFMREHMSSLARIHYVITDGGRQPNVVPDYAKVWYLVRAPQRDEVDSLYQRVLDCARGAAIMTGTKYQVQLLKAIWNLLPNRTLEHVLSEAMEQVGPPDFSKASHQFAEAISQTFEPGRKESFLLGQNLTQRQRKILEPKILNDILLDAPASPLEPRGSTDVGDVSWCCPTAQFTMACNALGTPGHSWQFVAQAGANVGREGMIAAAKVLAQAGYRLLQAPNLRRRVGEEFACRTEGRLYRSAMPKDQKPAFDQFR